MAVLGGYANVKLDDGRDLHLNQTVIKELVVLVMSDCNVEYNATFLITQGQQGN